VRFGAFLVRFGAPSGKDAPKRTKFSVFWCVLVRLLITKKSVRRILPPKSPKVVCAVDGFGGFMVPLLKSSALGENFLGVIFGFGKKNPKNQTSLSDFSFPKSKITPRQKNLTDLNETSRL